MEGKSFEQAVADIERPTNTHILQYIFLIYGALTIVIGVVVFFLLPDQPSTAWFLSEEEKKIGATSALPKITKAGYSGLDVRRSTSLHTRFY